MVVRNTTPEFSSLVVEGLEAQTRTTVALITAQAFEIALLQDKLRQQEIEIMTLRRQRDDLWSQVQDLTHDAKLPS